MIKAGRYIITVLLLFPFLVSAQGQNVTVRSSFDSTRIFIGDQINFTVTIEKPAGLKLNLPALKDTLVKNIEILSGPVIDSARENGRIKIIEKYRVTSFDSGRYQVPPVFAELMDVNRLKRFYSDYSLLEVMRIKIAPADTISKIFDIVKPYRAPVTIGEVMPWVLIIAVAGALVWFAIRFIKKFKKSGQEPEIVINPDPAHVIALRELEVLRNEKLWQNGEIKKYYSRLTEILRQYLENRYRVFSLELTTRETLDALVKTGFRKDEYYARLKNVLTSADLVKFAKYNPDPSENESIFGESWDFVMATKEVPALDVNGELTEIEREGKR
jgi:hypothetical protein